MKNVVTILWGVEFWNIFNEVCLPSLYGGKHPEGLCSAVGLTHVIITFRDQFKNLTFPIRPNFFAIEDLLEQTDIDPSNPVNLQSLLVSKLPEILAEDDIIAILPPDVIWPESFLFQMDKVMNAYDAAYTHYIRINDTVLKSDEQLVGLSSEELLSLVFRYWHDIESSHKLNGKRMTNWPEYVSMYSQKSNWYAAAINDKEPFIWHNRHRLNRFNQLTTVSAEKIFVFGSDELGNFGASLAPDFKDHVFFLEQDKRRAKLKKRVALAAHWKNSFGSTPSNFFCEKIIRIGGRVPDFAIGALKRYSSLCVAISNAMLIDKHVKDNLTDVLLRQPDKLSPKSFGSLVAQLSKKYWILFDRETAVEALSFADLQMETIDRPTFFAVEIQQNEFYDNYCCALLGAEPWLPSQLKMIDPSMLYIANLTANTVVIKRHQCKPAPVHHEFLYVTEFRNGIFFRQILFGIEIVGGICVLHFNGKKYRFPKSEKKFIFISDQNLYLEKVTRLYSAQRLLLILRFLSKMNWKSKRFLKNKVLSIFGSSIVKYFSVQRQRASTKKKIAKSTKIIPH